jgi:hypothetical protein
MRTMSWIKHPVIILFVAAIAAGCSSSDNNTTPGPITSDASTCGNNKKEVGEVCDGTDLNHMTCQTAMLGMFTGGKLACKADCSGFDTKGCTNGGGGAGGKGGSGNNGGTGGGVGGTGGGPKTDAGVDSGLDSGAGGTTGTDSGTKDSSVSPVDSGKKD